MKFAEYIDFKDCRRAADIGTGTGLLAILAAKKGATEVKATDISPLAVRLADLNARMANAIDVIETRQGHFFCDYEGTFDVITANLPQEIIPPAYGSSISTLQSQAIDGGGTGGNTILLDFLEVAPKYMHPHTRLYVIVNTITDYKQTLQKISTSYEATLVWQGITSVKAFVSENIGFFGGLIDRRIVDLVEDEAGNWHAHQFIYQLTLPP
ncbi:50S ribosomal protein L11 methyltransferase [Lichenifustis flavocetrariae]|uniref:50S ribosomal protein L11 methyltransferase n=1 Tax=Lichenifustis flavocetrariae TaxID=2949735 RepID=A0AA42CMN1_9HYPH|nr:50S ribosomal protein L11 methyltransferase [Lichenifustis flavocetrariae]MCW6512708.1 50S ribosomal protein L11 methyltransferase [Lichenifustis flavocetrariae]